METYYLTCISALVASLVGWIGVQQYRLASDRLRLDLWQKRYDIYKGAQRFLTLVLQEGTTDLKELFDFLRDTQDAYFLFRPDMADYLTNLYKKGVSLRTARVKRDGMPSGPERTRLCQEEADLLTELTNELNALKPRFGPYLRIARQ